MNFGSCEFCLSALKNEILLTKEFLNKYTCLTDAYLSVTFLLFLLYRTNTAVTYFVLNVKIINNTLSVFQFLENCNCPARSSAGYDVTYLQPISLYWGNSRATRLTGWFCIVEI